MLEESDWAIGPHQTPLRASKCLVVTGFPHTVCVRLLSSQRQRTTLEGNRKAGSKDQGSWSRQYYAIYCGAGGFTGIVKTEIIWGSCDRLPARAHLCELYKSPRGDSTVVQ